MEYNCFAASYIYMIVTFDENPEYLVSTKLSVNWQFSWSNVNIDIGIRWILTHGLPRGRDVVWRALCNRRLSDSRWWASRCMVRPINQQIRLGAHVAPRSAGFTHNVLVVDSVPANVRQNRSVQVWSVTWDGTGCEFDFGQSLYISFFIYLFIYLFVNLPAQLHLRGAQMTLAAFQEQFSFKCDSSGDLSVHGNEFQTVGPHTGKARGPEVIVLVNSRSPPNAKTDNQESTKQRRSHYGDIWARVATLNVTRRRIGNQCRSIIIGVMWSYFLAPDTSRAAAFCTCFHQAFTDAVQNELQ